MTGAAWLRPAFSRPAAPAPRWRRRPSALESFPEDVLAAHGMHRHPVAAALPEGITVGASLPGSSFAMAASAERGACSMMYLLPLTCSTPSMRISRRRSIPASPRDRHRRADQHGLAVEHRLGLAQVIGRQRRSGRHQIANQIRAAQPRRDFHGAAQQDHFGADAVIGQKTRQDVRIGRRDAHALQRLRAAIVESIRHRDAQLATAEIQAAAPSRTAARRRARRNARRFSSTTFKPTNPRSQTSSCTRSGMSSSRTNSTSSGMFSP
jgi:hypothetical protein